MSLARRKSPPRNPPVSVDSTEELQALQRFMASALMRPLNRGDRMVSRWRDGRSMRGVAARFMKGNGRMSPFERLEIYNRMYWFRVLDSLVEDCPGLRALLGETRFWRIAKAYLAAYPSVSYTLRNLPSRLARFLREQPRLCGAQAAAAVDMARLEWARVEAFDAADLSPLADADLAKNDPERLRFRLQPHLRLLRLDHEVDEFLLSLSDKDEAKGQASNVVLGPGAKRPRSAARRLVRSRLHLAVHRSEGRIYFKRLTPQQYRLLVLLGRGRRLGEACRAIFARSRSTVAEQQALLTQSFSLFRALGWLCPES